MSAKNMMIKRRNAADNGWEEVEVPVAANRPLQVDISKNPFVNGVPGVGAALATAGAGTLTAALIAGGIILRDPAGAARDDTTDTAENIIANATIGLDQNYKTFQFYVINTADAAEAITLIGGTGVTIVTPYAPTATEYTKILIPRYGMVKLELFRTSATTLVLRAV